MAQASKLEHPLTQTRPQSTREIRALEAASRAKPQPYYQSNAPWPTQFSNNSANSLGVGKGANGSLKWFNTDATATGAGVGSPCTIASDGTIYASGYDCILYAYNPDGSLKWTNKSAVEYRTYATASCAIGNDGTVYLPTSKGDIYAVNPDGTLKWVNNKARELAQKFNYGCAISPDGTIYAAGYGLTYGTGGTVFAINPDGSTKWTNDTLHNLAADCSATCSIAADGTIYISGSNGTFIAINPDGTNKWVNSRIKADGAGCEAPIMIGGDGTLYLVTDYKGYTYAFNPDGTLKWINKDISLYGVLTWTTAMGPDGTLYCGGFDGSNIYAISSSGIFKWYTRLESDDYVPISGISVAADGTIYAISAYGNVYAINPDGSRKWDNTTDINPHYVHGACSIATDGTLYVVDGNGTLYAISAVVNPPILVTLSPRSIVSGFTSSFAVITLSNAAPTGGKTVTLTHQYPNTISMPSIVTVAAGSKTANFIISCPQMHVEAFTDEITASVGKDSVTVTLSVLTVAIQSITVSPTSASQIYPSTGTITLGSPAPAGGWEVRLSTGASSLLSVPESVTVPEGETTWLFLATPHPTSTTHTVGIYAIDKLNSYKTCMLTVLGNNVTGLSLSPATIGGNGSSTGTVTIKSPAPYGGWRIDLAAGVPSLVDMPSRVVVPMGASSTTFTIQGKQSSRSYTMGIYANDGNSGQSTTLTLYGNTLAGLTLGSGTIGGCGSTTGTISLNCPAPFGGWKVNLSSSNRAAKFPSNIIVPAGSISTTFTISAHQYPISYTAPIIADDGSSTASAVLTVIGDGVASVGVFPGTVRAGYGAIGMVRLNSPAPAGGWNVYLVAGATGCVSTPTMITVPQGGTFAMFVVSTAVGYPVLTSVIYASDSGSQQSTYLKVVH